MSMKKLAPVAVALLLALPAVLVVAPSGAAQEAVPGATGITWVNQVGFEQRLYLDFGGTGQPACPATSPTAAPTYALRLTPRAGSTAGTVNDRQPCTISTTTPNPLGGSSDTVVRFETTPLVRGFNVTGNDALHVTLRGTFYGGQNVTVRLSSSGQNLVTGSRVIQTDELEASVSAVQLAIPLGPTGTNFFRPRDVVRLDVIVSPPPSDNDLQPQGLTYALSDVGSFLSLRSVDAVRAATWTEDERQTVRSLFRPLPAGAPVGSTTPLIVGYFAMDSVFGFADTQTGAPRFTLTLHGQPLRVGPNGDGSFVGIADRPRSDEGAGRAVWSFPANQLDYRGFTAGEYDLLVDKAYRDGSSLRSGIVHRIILSTQSVRLSAYTGEDLTHEVLAGSSTTFLLLVNNTGAVNDSFRLDTEFISGAPAFGWGAVVGGPHVTERQVRLAPNESKLVTVTVSAPFGAPGDASIFLVKARSTIDPSAPEQSVTVSARIASTSTRGIGFIPPTRTLLVEAGVPTDFSVYGWNRGTAIANMSLEIRDASADGWLVDFASGGTTTDRVLLAATRPGDVAEAVVRVVAPTNRASGSHSFIINATITDVQGVSVERTLVVELRSVAGVRVEILERIDAHGHVARLGPGLGTPPVGAGTAGSLDGVWFRVWVTNTGQAAETFTLTARRLPDACESGVYTPLDTDGSNFGFFWRGPGNQRTPTNTLLLSPNQTGELYLWRAINADAALPAPGGNACAQTDTFDFVVTARGDRTGVVGFDDATVSSAFGTSANGFLIEGVSRDASYAADKPYVDISQARRRSVTVPVDVGMPQITRVRLTNANAYVTYQDDGATISSAVTARLEGIDADAGWNISMRVLDPALSEAENPWRKSVTLENLRGDRAEGWVDTELEVRIEPPNASLAGETFPFFLQARAGSSSDTNTLAMRALITRVANLSIAPESTRILAHPGEEGAFLVVLRNDGAAETPVALRASINPDGTPDRGLGWSVSTSETEFVLPAYKTRTVAVLVRPPPTASVGAVGEVNLTVDWMRIPGLESSRRNDSLRLLVEPVAPDSLVLSAPVTAATAVQGGFANFTFTASSSRIPLHYRITTTPLPNWTVFVSPQQQNLTGAPQTVTMVLRVPTDIESGATFSSIVRIEEVGNAANFDTIPVTINVQGGRALAAVSVPASTATVDRGASRTFEVLVKNVGTVAGRIGLEARSVDPSWRVSFGGVNDTTNPYIDLGPNQLGVVNLTVAAPTFVPENTVVAIEVIANAPAFAQSARATIQARIHDYAIEMTINPTSTDLVPGLSKDFVAKLRNRGNDNDTVNLSYMTNVDLPEWLVQIPVDRVLIEPGGEKDIPFTIRSPTTTLPSPRTYSFKMFSSSLGGAAVNVTKTQTAVVTATVLDYASLDVDGDEKLELAVDRNKDTSDGYESFTEIFSEGLQTQVVEATRFNGKTRFLVDVPSDRLDGVADAWFDPENVFVAQIDDEHAFDVTKDRSPDYFLDTDRDGKIDRAYDPDTDRYLGVKEVKALGGDRTQYLVDTAGDERPERYYDPGGKFANDVHRISGQTDVIGIDTDNDGDVDKHYNVKTGEVTTASVANVQGFFVKYWYFVAAFAVMLLATIILVVRRRRHG